MAWVLLVVPEPESYSTLAPWLADRDVTDDPAVADSHPRFCEARGRQPLHRPLHTLNRVSVICVDRNQNGCRLSDIGVPSDSDSLPGVLFGWVAHGSTPPACYKPGRSCRRA